MSVLSHLDVDAVPTLHPDGGREVDDVAELSVLPRRPVPRPELAPGLVNANSQVVALEHVRYQQALHAVPEVHAVAGDGLDLSGRFSKFLQNDNIQTLEERKKFFNDCGFGPRQTKTRSTVRLTIGGSAGSNW